ncbi:hypothetical protein PIB30_016895 [Stylosanthes scabra]|uniref:Uncharacterized protein n=1 Tax=Stylosanthes scabra TaxID=79078 RepID=A0ABU6V5Q1_9FABA|nr:hypothetical protein [Stylosanthes scabra]
MGYFGSQYDKGCIPIIHIQGVVIPFPTPPPRDPNIIPFPRQVYKMRKKVAPKRKSETMRANQIRKEKEAKNAFNKKSEGKEKQ